LFIFTNLLCKALDKSLLRKYYKDGASVVTHFFVLIEKKRENTKRSKNLLEENPKKYIRVKRRHKGAQKVTKDWLRKFKNIKIKI
jgi:hypothetical protein